jgi:hypothetical protein
MMRGFLSGGKLSNRAYLIYRNRIIRTDTLALRSG